MKRKGLKHILSLGRGRGGGEAVSLFSPAWGDVKGLKLREERE